MTSAALDALASDVLPGDGCGVAAGSDVEFFLAVEDPVVGVFDDDGDELPTCRGPSLMN